MDIQEELAARQGHRRVMANRLLNGEVTIPELVTEDPTLLWGYKKLKDDLKEYMLDKAENKPDCEGFTNWEEDFDLHQKSYKKRHYWFWSTTPNKGKTTFLKTLED